MNLWILSLNNVFRESTSRIITYVLLFICVLRIVVFWADFVLFALNFDNPLFPRELLTHKLKLDLYFSLFLILPLIPLFYYLRRKRFFIGLSLLSVFLIILPQLLGPFISDMLTQFANNTLNILLKTRNQLITAFIFSQRLLSKSDNAQFSPSAASPILITTIFFDGIT